MAESILIIGPSGSGKSAAIETLSPDKTIVICPEDKVLPFSGAMQKYRTGSWDKSNFFPVKRIVQYDKSKVQSDPGIMDMLQYISISRPEILVVIIDTFTYAMVDSVMRDIHTDNYKKFNVFAEEIYNMINFIKKLRKNLTVIITAHVDEETDNTGTRRTSFKIPAGKLTKNNIVPEGMFTVVLYSGSSIIDGKPVHFFETKTNGFNTCKSPAGMFPQHYIPNDYKFVLQSYYAFFTGKEGPKIPDEFPIKQ